MLWTERAERALTILATGRLREVTPEHFEAMGCGEQPYTITTRGDAQACTCPDFTHKAPEYAGRKWCKHSLAVAMYYLLVKAEPKAEQPKQGRSRQDRLAFSRRRPAGARLHDRVPLVAKIAV